MSQEITVTQQIRVVNGNHVFPGPQGNFGNSTLQLDQTTPGGPVPGEMSAITTGQGTLVDLATSPYSAVITALGGWVIFKNTDPTNNINWGVDDGAGNLKEVGQMLPGDCAGPFRMSPNQSKYRFKALVAAASFAMYAFNK